MFFCINRYKRTKIVVRISTRTSDLYKYTERYLLISYNFINQLESKNNW